MTAIKKLNTAESAAAKKSKRAPAVEQTRTAPATTKIAHTRKAVKVAQTVQGTQIEQPRPLTPEAHIEPVAHRVNVAPEVTEKVAENPHDVSNGAERILLPARMELSSLDEAQHVLQSKYPPVQATYILDCALLSVIDMAGIQMLIGFIRSVTARGTKVEWDNYSVQVYQLASELGVTSQLGD